jgi:hypothetical protein
MAAARLAAARALACISVLAALAAAQTLLSDSASSSVAQGETHYYYVIANCGFSVSDGVGRIREYRSRPQRRARRSQSHARWKRLL